MLARNRPSQYMARLFLQFPRRRINAAAGGAISMLVVAASFPKVICASQLRHVSKGGAKPVHSVEQKERIADFGNGLGRRSVRAVIVDFHG